METCFANTKNTDEVSFVLAGDVKICHAFTRL